MHEWPGSELEQSCMNEHEQELGLWPTKLAGPTMSRDVVSVSIFQLRDYGNGDDNITNAFTIAIAKDIVNTTHC